MESWVFNKKEIRFIADLITAGGKVGFPYNISRVFRSRKNLHITFMNPDNSVTIKNGNTGKSDLLVFVADQSLTERKVMSL